MKFDADDKVKELPKGNNDIHIKAGAPKYAVSLPSHFRSVPELREEIQVSSQGDKFPTNT